MNIYLLKMFENKRQQLNCNEGNTTSTNDTTVQDKEGQQTIVTVRVRETGRHEFYFCQN